ncbi:MAG TPA: orotidine-5'-phosphate decarboxylase [Acidimicrobiales bacterium]|nr:orotidine-5'-phosphate decarboxylase [Acidimicrobiales bacterium]
MREPFGVRLRERIRALGPLCVGVDPSPKLIESWGRTDSVEGLEFFSLAVLEAVLGTAAVIKPQVSFFERFGAEGYRVLERLLSEARDADVLVVADAKRGDIKSTNDGYADAWLSDRSSLAVDALTVTPYVGVGALAPLFEVAQATGRGVFVLAATSNDEGRAVQTARTSEDERIEDLVLRSVSELNRRDDGLGSLGAVLGATRDRPDFNLASLGGPYLVPGVGSQGATADHVARLFARCPQGTVLVNVGRAILEAGPDRAGLRDAAQRWRDDLSAALL